MDALAWLKEHGAATESEDSDKDVQQARQSELGPTWLGTGGPKSAGNHNATSQCTDNHCDDQFKFELDLMLHVKTQDPFIGYVDESAGMSTLPTASTHTTSARTPSRTATTSSSCWVTGAPMAWPTGWSRTRRATHR